jgi:diphthamide synthase (EF-2-diphthine--ammonia ligase)
MKKGVILWSGGKDSAYSLYKARQEGIDVKYAITGYFRDMLVPPTEETIRAQVTAIGMESIILHCDLITFQIAVEKKLKELIETDNIEYVVHGEGHAISNVVWFRDMCRVLKLKPISPVLGVTTIDEMNELFDNNFKFIITRFIVSDFNDPIVAEYAGKDYTREIFNNVLVTHKTIADNPLGPAGPCQTFVYDGPIFNTPISIEMDAKPLSRVVLR